MQKIKKRSILVIDDAPEVAKLLKLHLTERYDVYEAHDGEEGLLMAGRVSPDLIILDLNMPKMNGITVYNKLSAGKGKPLVPVIILTVREEMAAVFKDLNVDGFITKPFNIGNVLHEIDTVMSNKYGVSANGEYKIAGGSKEILIVEDDPIVFNNLAITFLNAGYIVNSAKTGVAAIEKIMTDLPDLVVIKFGLSDISGDLVCSKLKQMPKTMDISFILYTSAGSTLEHNVAKEISRIIGVALVESDDHAILLKAAEKIFKQI
ncbi:MAG: response regulator [Candidatus Omnitrophica bacterium]|nr:response regulator [Candidatus Omnitrophota bacterium]